jgi:hypothetical protein
LNKEISFTEDICRLVSKETGEPEEKVMHHIDFLVHWLKKLSTSPDILNIRIPHVGYMYLNISKIKRSVEYFSNDENLNESWKPLLDRKT